MSRDDPAVGPYSRHSGPPMTLGNMRANGVRTLDAWCSARGCNHHSIVDVSELADDVPGAVHGAPAALHPLRPPDVRPNWGEYRAPEWGGGCTGICATLRLV
jgi:hypothetical protein